MKVQTLIERLQRIAEEHGDVEVMMREPFHQTLFEVGIVRFDVACANQFPEEWHMPKGFKFVMISHD